MNYFLFVEGAEAGGHVTTEHRQLCRLPMGARVSQIYSIKEFLEPKHSNWGVAQDEEIRPDCYDIRVINALQEFDLTLCSFECGWVCGKPEINKF